MAEKGDDISLFTQDQQSTSTNRAPVYTSLIATSLNLLNSTLGAGILSVSNSFTFCGLIPSVSILTGSAILSFISASMIVKMHTVTGYNSMQSLTQAALGSVGKTIMNISIALFCYSCMTAYVVMGTEIIQSWASALGFDLKTFWRRAATVVAYAFLLPIAMTIPRNVGFLGYISFSCFIALVLFFGGMCYKAVTILPKQGIDPTVETATMNLGVFNAFAVHVLSYSLSGIIIPVVKHMVPSLHKRFIACGISFFASYFIVVVPAVIGYLLFGADCQALILNNFDDSDPLFVIIRIACFIVLVSSYPVIGLSLLTMVSNLFYKSEDHQSLPWSKRSVCIAIENGFPLLVAIFLPNARPALAIGGALGGGVTNFVLPPLIYIKINRKKLNQPITWVMILFCAFGVIASGIATYEAVLDAIAQFSK